MTHLYVHVPFCVGKCPYCAFYSVNVSGGAVRGYLRNIFSEVDSYLPLGAVETLYLGGGSPSCIGEDNLKKLVEGLVERVGRAGEFTVEVNPHQVSEGMLDMLRGAGVNRLSVGGQSFRDAELELLGRPYRAGRIGAVVQMARRAGFDNIGVDLIFALPGSTLADWRCSLEKVVELGVEHVSAYSLSYELGTRFYHDLTDGKIDAVDEELDRQMYELTIDTLAAGGLKQYEISNFARCGKECRHNLNCWAGGEYLGVGPTAGSFWRGHSMMNGLMAENGGWEKVESEEVPGRDYACRVAVLNLRRRGGVDREEFWGRTGYKLEDLFGEAIKQNTARGLLEVDEVGVRLTREALGVADGVLADFA